MGKLYFVMMIVVSLLFVSGCGNNTLTGEEFVERMSEIGYTAGKADFSGDDRSRYVATKREERDRNIYYEIYFDVFEEKQDAKMLFDAWMGLYGGDEFGGVVI